MAMRSMLRAVAILASVALLMLAVGCAAPADPHADHNHGDDTATSAHDHDEPALMDLKYEEGSDGTLTLIVNDCKGETLLNKTGLSKQAIASEVANGVIELSWVTGTAPGAYECLYINRMTCQVSDTIVGEQGTDGNRIVYTEIKDGKMNIIVRDLFNKNGYNQVSVIDEAYTEGEYTVISAIRRGKDQVNVSYLTDKDGGHRILAVNLYEADEKQPTLATKKTEKK